MNSDTLSLRGTTRIGSTTSQSLLTKVPGVGTETPQPNAMDAEEIAKRDRYDRRTERLRFGRLGDMDRRDVTVWVLVSDIGGREEKVHRLIGKRWHESPSVLVFGNQDHAKRYAHLVNTPDSEFVPVEWTSSRLKTFCRKGHLKVVKVDPHQGHVIEHTQKHPHRSTSIDHSDFSPPSDSSVLSASDESAPSLHNLIGTAIDKHVSRPLNDMRRYRLSDDSGRSLHIAERAWHSNVGKDTWLGRLRLATKPLEGNRFLREEIRLSASEQEACLRVVETKDIVSPAAKPKIICRRTDPNSLSWEISRVFASEANPSGELLSTI
jgi:hypothetical protein